MKIFNDASKMIVYPLLVSMLIGIATACHNSQHFAAARARARGVRTSLQNDPNSTNGETFEIISCDGLNYVPFSAYELRHMAAVSVFPDEAELKVADGGRITCYFDKPQEYCSWVNVPDGQFRFWIAKYDIPFDRLRFDCTSQQTFPFEGGFLMAGGEPAVGPQRVSTEVSIPCQLGEAALKFHYWTNSDDIILRYCVITEQETKCQDILPQMNPYNITIREQFGPFTIRLEAINMYSNTMVLIDNLYYEGKICEFVDEFESTTVSATFMETTIPNTFGFSEPMSNPGASDNFQAALESGTNDSGTEEIWSQTQNELGPEAPVSNFAETSTAWTDNFSQTPAPFEFSWTTSEVPTSTIAEVPTTSESLQNFFLGNNFGLGIQPIQQGAGHFRPELPLSFVQPTTSATAPESFLEDLEGISADAAELSACDALRCDFNLGHTCYFNTRGIGSTAAWTISNTLIGNRHTGIQRVNLKDAHRIGYISIGDDQVDHSDDIFTLESPKFSLKTNAYLICFESFDYCPYTSPSVHPHYFWQQQKVFIQPGIRKIYFLGESVGKNLFLAIDNVRLEGESGEDICS